MRPRALDRCDLLNFGGLRTEQGGFRVGQAVGGFSVDFQSLQFRGD